MKGTLTLVLGGVRSGKSRFAEELALKLGGDNVLFVATAENRDGEMDHRIQKHKESRPDSWVTLEQPLGVGHAILEREESSRIILIDCLTILVSNVLCQDPDLILSPKSIDQIHHQLMNEIDQIIEVARVKRSHVIVVSGEVGLGIVPEHPLGRVFRDLLGWANQSLAKRANATYMMISGFAVPLHEIAMSMDQVSDKLSRSIAPFENVS
ncbi:MAG: bifunctional adenosylcobinamide kinase/adenosylcobinamide-phosphate guanylyltransferase [Planctomycetota bacterium]|nr:bifunctional adenosylcobinamide kinase/adenosylcobinamide-phosphate guanylyltransferase [Planctomycetota bacterium]